MRVGNATFTIGQLAKAAGVPVTTLRYYERTGLLKPRGRTGNNYRVYTAAELEQLKFIRHAQAAGLSLDDVANLIHLTCDRRRAPCLHVQAILQDRLADLDRRLAELRAGKRAVASAIRACQCAPHAGLCSAIERLSDAPRV